MYVGLSQDTCQNTYKEGCYGNLHLRPRLEFERSIMLERQLERQREGVAKAKKAGKYKGRKPLPLEIQEKVKHLIKHGTSKAEAARQLKIGEASVYRILKKSPIEKDLKKTTM